MIIDRTTLTRNLRQNVRNPSEITSEVQCKYLTRIKLVGLYLFSFIIYKFVLLSYIQDEGEKE
jgi:hypothetical protein